MYEALHALAFHLPHAPTEEFVDDLAQTICNQDPDHNVRDIVLAAKLVHDYSKSMQITISQKSSIIPSNASAKKASEQLRKIGIDIQTAPSAEDLGIQCNGGTRRNTQTMQNEAEQRHEESKTG